MGAGAWITIIVSIIAIALFFANKDKNNQIEQLRREIVDEKNFCENQFISLTKEVGSGNVSVDISAKKADAFTQLKREIVKQFEIERRKTENFEKRYQKVLLAYLTKRKKTEFEAIAEIEEAISFDYEELGSKNIYRTDYVASLMADFYSTNIKEAEKSLSWMGQQSRSLKIADVRSDANQIIEHAKKSQYSYEYALLQFLKTHPEIDVRTSLQEYGISLDEVNQLLSDRLMTGSSDVSRLEDEISTLKKKYETKIDELQSRCKELSDMNNQYLSFRDRRWALLRDTASEYRKEFESNLTAIPYMSRIIADIMTIDIDRLAYSLSWGNNQERKKKVISLNALKKEKVEEIERIKGAEYQLAYLLELYPVLQEVLDTEFKDLELSYGDVVDADPVRRYMDSDSYRLLSESERNQLALDRYIESRKKSKWQIGRDYELYCGYLYEKKGYKVDYYGSYNGLEDLGRDLIVSKDDKIVIVQCKYWSATKEIHENHIMQLYGSVIEFNIEKEQKAKGVLITNTVLSEKAKEFAKVLDIEYRENLPIKEFPRIKCNIGVGEWGEKTKIYHLPFDQQYDTTKVDGKGEFMAMTVEEAENAGFRRAYRWYGE